MGKYGTVYDYPQTPKPSPAEPKLRNDNDNNANENDSSNSDGSPSRNTILEEALQHVFPSSQLDALNEMVSDENNSESSYDTNARTSAEFSCQDLSFYEETEEAGGGMQVLTPKRVFPASSLYNPKKSPLENRNKILCDILGIGADSAVPSQ